MGLISRVSSRTYRCLQKMLQTNRKNNMTSNAGLFPKEATQKRNFGYKNRNMSHKIRPVNVPKDSKDVKYKPPGTDNERYQNKGNGDAPVTKKTTRRPKPNNFEQKQPQQQQPQQQAQPHT